MTTLPWSYRVCKRKLGAVRARELVLDTYQRDGTIKGTARLLSCSKNTVRLAIVKDARGVGLRDADRTPHRQPRRLDSHIEERVCTKRKNTGYGKRRLRKMLLRDDDLDVPESTIGKVIKRNNVPAKVYRSAWRRKTRRQYDRSALVPFERNEVDVKEILDQKGLPQEVYDRFARLRIPLYQWTWMEVASRVRFVAYSYEHTWSNGQAFFRLVTAWLRLFGIVEPLVCSIDGGKEWHATTERSFEESRHSFYAPLGLQMSLIRKGHPEDNPFVERSHRSDDEECYAPLGMQVQGEPSFLMIVRWWHCFFNTERPHEGVGGKTPIEALKEKRPEVHPAIAHFPPIILDRHFAPAHPTEGGQNVFDYYHKVP